MLFCPYAKRKKRGLSIFPPFKGELILNAGSQTFSIHNSLESPVLNGLNVWARNGDGYEEEEGIVEGGGGLDIHVECHSCENTRWEMDNWVNHFVMHCRTFDSSVSCFVFWPGGRPRALGVGRPLSSLEMGGSWVANWLLSFVGDCNKTWVDR